VVQMQTGEGKTMVAALAAIHRSLSGRGVHVITTSSYLAERDAEELRPVFEKLGISLGVLRPTDPQAKTRLAYAADITYGPGYQFGFDYLRDQLALRSAGEVRLGAELRAGMNGAPTRYVPLRQRPREMAIIDEIDSVLLDEASTPLILSGPASAHDDPLAYELARGCVDRFVEGTDFRFDPRSQRIMISVPAVTRSQHELELNRGVRLSRPWVTYLRNAIQARHRLIRDEHYAVVDGDIHIVDQNTGRLFADRSWRDGLHQAVQAKEYVEITPSESSLARITRQRYFQQYKHLAGLTGTAVGAESEFQRVYSLRVVPVATARPCLRQIEPLRVFESLATKRRAIAADTNLRHQRGQPVLIGTRTIEESRRLSEELGAVSVPHVVLNGLQDADEASIVAQAGLVGAVTIATNMAGRGTDIKLSQESRQAGGLHVVVSEPHSSSRVDRQLVGRCCRQGDPGSAQAFLSAEDALLLEHAPRLAERIRRHADADGEYRSDLSAEVLRIQQRVEAEQSRQRVVLLEQDEWLDGVRQVLSGAESL
jgi:preprotein translocase subunit SecA